MPSVFRATSNQAALDDMKRGRAGERGGRGAETCGFHETLKRAYNAHQPVEFTPDAVKLALLMQFSLYVNGNAEELRDKFAAHKEGKKEVSVEYNGGESPTAVEMATDLADKLREHIPQPRYVDWIRSGFSTTSVLETGASAVAALATTQAFYDFSANFRCGIPQVTMHGTMEDWRALRTWADTLLEFDTEERLMSRWHRSIAAVLDGFVASFERPEDKSTLLFWDCVHSNTRAGSGSEKHAGWAVVFSAFDKDGRWALKNLRSTTNASYNFGVLDGAASSGLTKAPLHITGATPLAGHWYLTTSLGYKVDRSSHALKAAIDVQLLPRTKFERQILKEASKISERISQSSSPSLLYVPPWKRGMLNLR